MATLVFTDTETTGFGDCRVIELAMGISTEPGTAIIETYRAKPPIPINLEAMMIHHITEEMVADLPLFNELPQYQHILDTLETSLVVAHNAEFDMDALSREGIKISSYIDTQRLARHIYPDFKLHKLQYLRYKLGLKVDANAHSAEGDVMVLMAVFNNLIKTLQEIEAWTYEEAIERARRISLQRSK